MNSKIITRYPDIKKHILEMAEEVSERKSDKIIETPLISRDFTKKRIQIDTEKTIIEFYETFSKGLEELILQLINSGNFTDEVIDIFQKIPASLKLSKLESKTPREICEINDEKMNLFNQAAVSLYESKNYENSSAVYAFLSFFDPKEIAYFIGWGNSEFFRKNYEQALKVYQKVNELIPKCIEAYLYACHCNIALGRVNDAKECLEQALEMIQQNPELETWIPTIKALKQSIS